MKQITLSHLSLFLLLLFASISCQKKHEPKSTILQPNHKNLATTNPANSNNPEDAAGYWHNDGMDYIKANISSSTTTAQFATLLRYYIANYPTAPYTHPDDQYLQDLTDALTSGNVSFSQSVFLGNDAYNYYIDLVADIENENFAEGEYDDYWDLIVAWEDDVINDGLLASQDRKILLSCSSVLRWSGYYWINQDMEEWPNPIFDHSTARPWWMVALWDALGVAVGSTGGPSTAILAGIYASSAAAIAVDGGLEEISG